MKGKLNSILDKTLGVKLVRTKIVGLSHSSSKKINIPVHIEFIGPSGVGKTTLFNKLFKLRKRDDKWLSRKEIVFLAKQSKSKNTKKEDCQVCFKLLEYKAISILQKEYSIENKIRVMRFFLHNMEEEVLIRNYNKDYLVVSEDGVFHNFSNELICLHNEFEEDFNLFLENRIIVFCFNTAENIARQFKKRLDEGGWRPQMQDMSLSEMVEQQRKVLNKKKELVSLIQSKGRPIIYINTDNDINDNIKIIEKFIKDNQL